MNLYTVYYILLSHYSKNSIHDIPKQANKSHRFVITSVSRLNIAVQNICLTTRSYNHYCMNYPSLQFLMQAFISALKANRFPSELVQKPL